MVVDLYIEISNLARGCDITLYILILFSIVLSYANCWMLNLQHGISLLLSRVEAKCFSQYNIYFVEHFYQLTLNHAHSLSMWIPSYSGTYTVSPKIPVWLHYLFGADKLQV